MAGKKPWVAASVIALALTVAGSALAYIVPADVILSRIASHRKGLGIDTLILEGTHTRNGEAAPLWAAVQTGRAWRTQTRRGNSTEVDLLVKDRRWRFNLGSPAGTPERDPHDLILTFLFPTGSDSGGKRGEAFLKKHGIDDGTVSMGRADGRVAFIIGAKPWEPTKPQLWVDQELLVPLRLIYVDKGTNVVHEQRLSGYGGEMVDQWFPRRIEHLENGKVIERLEIRKLEVNPSVDKDLLSPP